MSHDQRTRNISRLHEVLTSDSYSGYDVVIVSSSTRDEAAYQQSLLERAFGAIRTTNGDLGHRVMVLSVDDPTEGGQLLGQAFTWLRAVERASEAGYDLESLVRRGSVRTAIYHNGGKGERASPLTQGLGNSRGSQNLAGTVKLSDGSQSELELLLAVVLQTSSLAVTNDGSAIDTFWTSQLLFDTKPTEKTAPSGLPLEKYVVRVANEQVTPKQMHDFGTALLRSDGSVETFFGNKQFGRRDKSGEWEFVEERRSDWDVDGFQLAFDFGSFRTRVDLHFDLMHYYDRNEAWSEVARQGFVSRSRARDIDPHFLQPLVAILRALKRSKTSIDPATHVGLRELGGEESMLEARIADLHTSLAKVAGESFGKTDPVGLRDALGFYLLFGDRPYFADFDAVVGSILFESDAYWLTFRRPIDVGNEKLSMITDVTGFRQEIAANGELITREANAADRLFSSDMRLLRGIEESAVCRFRVGDSEFTLSAEEVKTGAEIAEVFVKGSVIAGNTVLLPGSRIEDSVLDNVVGRVDARHSYIESTSACEISATSSVVHKCIDPGRLEARAEVVSDAFREGIRDEGFPQGQTRLRAPIGYDPQAKVKRPDGSTVSHDEVTRTEGGSLTFAEVRTWPSVRSRNDAIESKIRSSVEKTALISR